MAALSHAGLTRVKSDYLWVRLRLTRSCESEFIKPKVTRVKNGIKRGLSLTLAPSIFKPKWS